MQFRASFYWMVQAIFTCVVFCPVGLFAQDVAPPADDEPSADVAAPAEAEPPAPPVDRYAVPDGDVEQLMKFIGELETFRPTSREEYMTHRVKTPVALEAAAKKIQDLETDKESEAWQKSVAVLLGASIGKLMQASPEQRKETVAELIDYLSNKELATSDIGLAMNASRTLGYVAEPNEAAEANEALAKIFAESSNADLERYADMLAGTARRMRLPGNEMELQGTRMDGTKFNLTELKGKVVLVDFWATWCGPCRAEYPNMLKNYEAYHDKGFEIVGVSLDQNRGALEKYIEEQQLPWIILHEQEAGGKNPASTEYGITGIPTMFLVGKDGKVISTKARGEELTRLLAEIFGSAEAVNAEQE